MKFSFAYYLLLLYTTVMFKPLIPVISDAWSHAFAEARHIATIHAKYGEHHLEQQVSADENDTNGKSQNTTKTIEPVPVHVAEDVYSKTINIAQSPKTYTVLFVPGLPVIASCVTTPPPDVAL